VAIINQLFERKNLSALQTLVRISETNEVALGTFNFVDSLIDSLENSYFESDVKVQMLRLVANMLINSEEDQREEPILKRVLDLQQLHQTSESLSLRQEYAYLLQCLAQWAPTLVFSQAMPTVQEIIKDRWTEPTTKNSLKHSIDRWVR